jgi:sulfide:quinone oxidoreductase
MSADDVTVALEPVYRRTRIPFIQALAVSLWPEGDAADPRPAVDVRHTSPERAGETERIRYDYLVNATGPKLDFGATPGLGPDGSSWSVCTAGDAVQAAEALRAVIERLRSGVPQRLVIGMGHGTCTCEGAAFEYAFDVDHELRAAGVRDLAEIVYLTNEHELGDFGVGGMVLGQRGLLTSSQTWAESLFRERGVRAILGAHVERVEEGMVSYETLEGEHDSLGFDFAMLLPPFRGADLTAQDRSGGDITSTLFAPSGFLKVDADYTPRPYEEWGPADWPSTYQSPTYSTLFGIGIAFAPPHQLSRPRTSPAGTVITPSPPRTGMPSATMGRQVARTLADLIDPAAAEGQAGSSVSSSGANSQNAS